MPRISTEDMNRMLEDSLRDAIMDPEVLNFGLPPEMRGRIQRSFTPSPPQPKPRLTTWNVKHRWPAHCMKTEKASRRYPGFKRLV
jgi:hypothetical protein